MIIVDPRTYTEIASQAGDNVAALATKMTISIALTAISHQPHRNCAAPSTETN